MPVAGGIDATKCLVYVIACFLLSASKDSSVRYVISSRTLNAILELCFCTVAPATVSVTASLKSHSFIHSFMLNNMLMLTASDVVAVTGNHPCASSVPVRTQAGVLGRPVAAP